MKNNEKRAVSPREEHSELVVLCGEWPPHAFTEDAMRQCSTTLAYSSSQPLSFSPGLKSCFNTRMVNSENTTRSAPVTQTNDSLFVWLLSMIHPWPESITIS
ncbi:hypothetical protein RB195_006446 [Necator americanus]|uniref:Uncharacterized protein n=1 Tax=Necator americanus TaxID=51031 RepID=A0ABR1BSN5_NECAM